MPGNLIHYLSVTPSTPLGSLKRYLRQPYNALLPHIVSKPKREIPVALKSHSFAFVNHIDSKPTTPTQIGLASESAQATLPFFSLGLTSGHCPDTQMETLS